MRRRAILLLLAIAGALVVVGGVAYAAAVTCDGTGDKDPDTGECRGTKRADTIDGTEGPEVIKALAGNDLVVGNGGADEIYGDEGNDLVDAHGGNDTIYGGPDGDGSAEGTDFATSTNLEGAENSDKVYGGGGNDYIDAAQHDTSGSKDHSYGGRGNDHIFAIDNNKDIINCGKGKGDVALVDQEVGLDTTKGCEQVIVED